MLTYDPALPDALSRMRHALGDTDGAAPLEQDETYLATLSLHGEALGTAAMAEALAARFAQQPDAVDVGGLSASWRERVRTWLALAARLRAEAGAAAGKAESAAAAIAGSIIGRREDRGASEYVRPAGVWSGGV